MTVQDDGPQTANTEVECLIAIQPYLIMDFRSLSDSSYYN